MNCDMLGVKEIGQIDVSYETGISMKTLELLPFKFIALIFSLISHEICKLDGSIHSTFLH